MTSPLSVSRSDLCRILSLDGGGAKGFYTLGVLKEIEALLGPPLHERFQLMFGTSTGGIIAALLALGHTVDEVHVLYKEHVPTIMRNRTKAGRSQALADLAKVVFGDRTFEHTKTDLGIVATRWDFEKPMIFKSSVAQAHGRHSTFVPGFGCTIGDAVRGSCSAYPFFARPVLTTGRGEQVELIDGGYCANNPTLYAIADAVKALEYAPSELRVVSIGVGVYPEPKRRLVRRAINGFFLVRLLQKTLDINTTSMEELRRVLYKDIQTVRINDTFEKPEMATDLMEYDIRKLGLLYQRGGESFAKYEAELKRLFDLGTKLT